jgi:hypothetical protein
MNTQLDLYFINTRENKKMFVKVDSVTIKKNAAKTKIYNQLLASFGFIPSTGSESKIFKDFQFFNQSEAMATILDVGQGHKT